MVSFEFQSFSIFTFSSVSCLVFAVGSYFWVPETQNFTKRKSETKNLQLSIERFKWIDKKRHVVGGFH